MFSLSFFLKNSWLGIAVLFITACQPTAEKVIEKMDYAKINPLVYKSLKKIPDSINVGIPFLKTYYSNNQQPLFVTENDSAYTKIDTLIHYLSKSEEHGIANNYLFADSLAYWKSQLLNSNSINYILTEKIERHAALSYIKYCTGICYGFLNPKYFTNYHYTTAIPDSNFMVQILKATVSCDSLATLITQIQPQSAEYKKLQNLRNVYMQYIDSIIQPIPLLDKDEIIKYGEHHRSIPLIKQRLSITQLLSADSVPNYMFDKQLLHAINKFQKDNDFLSEKSIDNLTINALNRPFSYYINLIDCNLERLRWQPTALANQTKYIRVNVASKTLKAIRNDSVILDMNICVGRPPKHLTPFLESKIYEGILNPKWRVPNSIIIKEFAPIMIKGDTGYLKRNRLRIFYKGREIPHDSVKWEKLTEKYQPYSIEQDSGALNSLGRIKFSFPNTFDIYLHDTNYKSIFKKYKRDVSHGCVRVEKPIELLLFCLPELKKPKPDDVKKQNILCDKIRLNLDMKPKTKDGKKYLDELMKANDSTDFRMREVKIYPYVPILIDYRTFDTDSKENIRFCEDIYGMDSLLYHSMHSMMGDSILSTVGTY
jgi:L,D-transpeptidase YcbB